MGAELGVIVVGVLIALWADGWVSDRADRRVETSRIAALRENVSATRGRLEAARRETTRAAEALRTVAHWQSVQVSDEAERVLLNALFYGPSFVPEMNVYADLKSSGDLALLRSGRLRQALAKMDATLEQVMTLQADLLTVQQLNYDPYLINERALGSTFGPLIDLPDLPQDPVEPVRDLRVLRNLVIFKLNMVDQLLARYSDAEQTLDLIDAAADEAR